MKLSRRDVRVWMTTELTNHPDRYRDRWGWDAPKLWRTALKEFYVPAGQEYLAPYAWLDNLAHDLVEERR